MSQPTQTEILRWAVETFGDIAVNPVERGARVAEEAIETAQVMGVSKEHAQRILDRVYSRPPGKLCEEIGSIGITAYALAESVYMSFDACVRMEFERIKKIPQDHWKKRHAEKVSERTAEQ